MDSKAALRSRLENLSPEQRAALAQQIAHLREQQKSSPVAGTSYPLSLAQRRLWMLSQLGSDASAAYNITSAFCFDGDLEPGRLEQAWRSLLASNEVLRSAFMQEGDELLQIPRDAAAWSLQQRVLAPELDVETQMLQLASAEAAAPFDLQHDWLLRVIYCATETGQCGLIIVIHHSVCDGLSITSMITELAQHYKGAERSADGASALRSTGALQYRDYVKYETGLDTSRARAYWKGIFADAPETLDALLDLPRPAAKDFSGRLVAGMLARPETVAFEALCHAHNATLYMGLVALVQLILARFANVDEVTLGMPVAGRLGAEFDKVVGPFVNTIALRQSIDLKQSFPELLVQVRRRVLEGFQHQGLAFDELVTELGFAKDPSRSPLYDAMLGLTSADEMVLGFRDGAGGVSVGRPLRIPHAFSKVDLTFHFEKGSDGSLRLDLEYADSVLLEATANRLCEAWCLLATALPRQPTDPLGAFSLQSEEERRLLLQQVNATARPYPRQSSLVCEFRQTVQRYPDAIAVHAGENQVSYRVLDTLSDQLAHALLNRQSHRPGCRIALMLEKDERALIVILAILKSRGVYVPLAANTPLERVSDVLEAGGVQIIFGEADRLEELSQLDVELIDTNGLLAAVSQGSYELAQVSESKTDDTTTDTSLAPAYLMFTSGSTGKPKGTLIDQRAVLRLVCNTDFHQVQAKERVLLTGSLAFDAATFEIWGPLLNGGCVCIPGGTALLEVHEFRALVDHYQVDTAFLTTGLFNQLVDNSLTAFGRLQTVLTGGEKVSVEHVSKLLLGHPGLKLLHVYGPTENTTFSTWHRIGVGDLALATIPIGRPIANSRIYLLDQDLRPVPVGVPGEIYCGGDGIARGYIEQPDADRSGPAVFLEDPFQPPGTGRLYRTGDIAKWNHRHELVFLGRNDRQVKIRGFRVEPGEVEHHLRTLQGVTDAFVQARAAGGSSELVAWLVVSAGPATTIASLRKALQGRVPNYMLPAKVVCVERLPLNANGKVDISALPLPEDDTDRGAADQLHQQLHGQAEQDLAGLYASVLGLAGSATLAIDRDANFFSLGGDSIRAIQLVSLARSRGYHFTLKDIFASETLAGLAAVATVTPVSAIETVLRSGPMSPTQLWWLEHCGTPASHFNLSSVFKLVAPIDMSALRSALDELLTLHPALRLTLDINTQQQSISDTGRYVLREFEAVALRQPCWQELQETIDLQAGILLAVGVVNEADSSYLAVVVHHLAADEVSGRLFAENLGRLYQRHLQDSQSSPHSHMNSDWQQPVRESLGPINWAAQLQEAVRSGAMDCDLPYWQDVVTSGRRVLERQQEVFSDAHAVRSSAMQTLSRSETQVLLRDGALLLRMKPQELLLASFIRAWQRMLGFTDCLLSLEGHGRESFDGLGDCSSTLGWFTSLYPFVFASSTGQQLDLYREVKDCVRRVPANGFTYLPLRYYEGEVVRETLQLSPQISFNYLGENADNQGAWLNAASEQAGNDHGDGVTEPFKLDVLARITGGQFELALRGLNPSPTASLADFATAWMEELGSLLARLQAIAAGKVSHDCLLSLSDSLVPFASLAELDATLAALQLSGTAVEEILPLTGMQAGMWLHCTTHPSAYQDQVALRLHQTLDEARFGSAVRALIAETQALRTGFAQAPDGELLQIVFRSRTGNYQFLDFHSGEGRGDSLRGEDREGDLARLRATLRSKQRDLLQDSLFNITLVRVDEACFELIIDFHHMALDGWTSALLLQRLEALYFIEDNGGEGNGGAHNAASGMRSYFEWLGRKGAVQARDYWKDLLGDYQSRSDVPAHLPRVPLIEPVPLFVETRTGAALHARLLSWCEREGVTLNAVVQALWGIFLGRLTGSDDLVFGATVSGRDSDLAGVSRIAGMLINTLPVRIRIADAASFPELVHATARQFAESMSFGHLSLAEIQTLSPARAGLVTHALVFENYPASAAARWQWIPHEIYDPMHFEFGLLVAPLSNDLSFRFVVDGSLYLQDRLEKMGADLCELLATLVDKQQPLDKVVQAGTAGWSLSANFTADSLIGLLQYHEHISGDSGAVTLLPYDQSVQELINPDSRLRRLQARQHVVLWRPALDADGNVLQSDSSGQLAELTAALQTFAGARPDTRLFLVLCPWREAHGQDPDHQAPGHQARDRTRYREFAAYAKGALAGIRNAEVLSAEGFADTYALQQSCYPPEQVFGDIPYTEEFFAAVANQLVRLCDLQSRRPVKVLVVDADDTLWGGIVGEEGVDGVRLDASHLCLQHKLLDARAAGALICLATKNNEEDVRAVFERREMPLRWEHLTRVCAGWRPKSESIVALAADLSLGLDSFVFIDDSPLECEQVLAACPGLLAIHLPPAQDRQTFLHHLWLLDARAATREDAVRAQMYAEELQRTQVRKSTATYAEFIASLNIRVDMHGMQQSDVPRMAQLSQRTNQFNTTGICYSEAELAALSLVPDADIRCISVADKYGDYGLTGSVFIRRAPEVWTILGFMLSCRVLGRGVEHTILRQLAEEAAAGGARELCIDFVRLARNTPALQFLQSISNAFAEVQQSADSTSFRLPVTESAYWRPGADDGAEAPAAIAAKKTTAQGLDSSGRQNQEDRAQYGAAKTNLLAIRRSHYYRHLASRLNSGTAILHELQHQSVIQLSSTAGDRAAIKTPPVTQTELTLAGFFTELLGLVEIFREDSFQALGGHSLKAMMLFARISVRYGLTLDFCDLQAYPTLTALSSRIDSTVREANPDLAAQPVLQSLPVAGSYPVSPGQSRLWMLEQLRAAGPSPFHMHATLTVSGNIDRQALDCALHVLLQRHEALRTCFREDVHGRVGQVVVPDVSSGDDLASQSARVHWIDDVLEDSELNARATTHSELAFDLSRAPLIRLAAGKLASGRSFIFITLHHIICDGWSIGILSKDLSSLYRQYSEDGHSASAADPELANRLQFRDFASWQLNWLASAAGARSVQFWRGHFAEPVEALQLPAACPRPTLKQNAGASVHIDIEVAVWTGFTQYVSRLGISDFSGLFAALQLVLARLSGQRDFCIGTVVAGRQHPQLESLIGFFVNVLPLRATLDFAHPVEAFLRTVAAEVNACLSHQGVPFDTIISNLELPRDPGRTPLFDVLLVLQNTEIEDLRFGAHVASVHPVASTTSQYDLTLSAFPTVHGGLKLLAEYDSVIFSAANIELILRCIARTLKGLLETTRTVTLANVQWLQESDIACVKSFEGTLLDHQQTLLPDIFRHAAKGASGRIRDSENDWSYAELAGEMQRISAWLRTGLSWATEKKQVHVGVIGRRSVRSVAAMLGVMDAGSVYIPLDMNNPFERLALIVDEGAVDILLSTDQEGAALAIELVQNQQGIRHVQYASAVCEAGQGLNDVRVGCNDIAYMIFTSGSTGKPKGVQISHAAFSAMIRQQIAAFDVQSDDVCAQFAALSFDASLSEIFLALGTGASLAITPDAARRNIDLFVRWLNEKAVTVITLPPVFLRALDKRSLGTLRVLVTAGEAAIGEDMRHYASSLRVVNAYGPTETAVCASTYPVRAGDQWPFGVPIGNPLPGVLLTVRDSMGARVPVGVTGELYIGGATLGHGYYGAPELTAQKFTTLFAQAQADGSQPSEALRRWYRSGDLVRWRADGLLEFAGRIDTQVKLRGYRIEPGEIEHAARLIDGVDDAHALVHPQLGLLLYCVTGFAQDARQALKSNIITALGKSLPRYMLPGTVLLLDGFPLSSAGKIARETLLALAVASDVNFVPPATNEEQVLAQAWRRVLKAERVGLSDDFFALGGDSIKALEVINALRSLGSTCELKDFFNSPLLKEMAAVLTPWRVSDNYREALAGNIDLLPVQSWFLDSRDSKVAGHFHIVAELDVSPSVSESLLIQALAALTRNHDSLRARFYVRDGSWLQEIQETLNIDDVLIRYQRANAAETQEDRSAIDALACRPFDLESGPLIRCVLVQTSNGNTESLVLTLHHLVADWVSLRILIADLEAITRALLKGDDVACQSPPHLLRELAEARRAEWGSIPPSAIEAYRKSRAMVDALAPDCGIHSELHTLHLQAGAADLARLRGFLQGQSADQQIEFRLQDLLLATVLSELEDLLPVGEIPLLVENHGRDNILDLTRQVAWLTRARLFSLELGKFSGQDALLQARRVLQPDAMLPDAFVCSAGDPVKRHGLPALASFNYLGEFDNSQQSDDLFSLTGRVFERAMAAASPVDVPLHMEFYIVDCALEIQVAWSPKVFASDSMRACWERVRCKLTTCDYQ